MDTMDKWRISGAAIEEISYGRVGQAVETATKIAFLECDGLHPRAKRPRQTTVTIIGKTPDDKKVEIKIEMVVDIKGQGEQQ